MIKQVDERNKEAHRKIYKEKQYNGEVGDYLKETLSLAREASYKKGIDFALVLSAANEMGVGNYDEGLGFLEDIHEASMDDHSTDLTRMSYYNAYMKYYGEHTGNDDMAIHYAKKELLAAEAIGDMHEIMRVKMNNGYLYARSGFFDTAVDIYKEIIEYGLSTNDVRLLAYVYINLADLHLNTDSLILSEEYYKKALNYAKELDLLLLQDVAMFSLAKIETLKGEYEKALSLLEEGERLGHVSERVQDIFERAHEYIGIYRLTNRHEEAYACILGLEDKLTQLENLPVKAEFFKIKSDLCGEMGMYKEAFEALKVHMALTKQLNENRVEDAVSKMIHEDYKKELARLDTLAAIGRELTMLTDIDEMLLKLRTEFSTYLHADTIGVGLLKDNALHFEHYYHGDRKILTRVTSVDSEVSLAAWTIRNKKDLILNNLREEYVDYVPRIGVLDEESDDAIKSTMFGLLTVGEETIGVFTVQSKKKNAYSSVEAKMFRIISDYLAVAVHNAEQRHVLKKLSVVDKLTNLLNRRGVLDFFDHKVTQFSKSVAIIMLDLDYFKRINDTYGHTAGDEALKYVADVLRTVEESNVAAARLGGEEFSIIAIDKREDEVETLAEQLRMEIENLNLSFYGKKIKLTTSIGVVYKEGHEDLSYNDLYFEADKALYQAKTNGRNRVEIGGNV